MKYKITIATLLFAGSISQIQSFQWLKDKFDSLTKSDSVGAAGQYKRDGYRIFQGQRRGDINAAKRRIQELERTLDGQLDTCARAANDTEEQDCLSDLSTTVDKIEEQMRQSDYAKSRLKDSKAREREEFGR